MNSKTETTRDRDAEHKRNTDRAEWLIECQEAMFTRALRKWRAEENEEPSELLRESLKANAYATAQFHFSVADWKAPLSNSRAELASYIVGIQRGFNWTARADQLEQNHGLLETSAFDVGRELLFMHSAPFYCSAFLTGPEELMYYRCVAIYAHFHPHKS